MTRTETSRPPPDTRATADAVARRHGLRDGLSGREAWRRAELVAAEDLAGLWLLAVLTRDRQTITVGTSRWGLVFDSAQVWSS